LNSGFFARYKLGSSAASISDSFSFSLAFKVSLGHDLSRMLIQEAVAPVFRQRGPSHGVLKFEVEVDDAGDSDGKPCRFVTRIVCTHGMLLLRQNTSLRVSDLVKTFALTYEAIDLNHPVFDRNNSLNRWTIKSSFLRENLDFFSPKVEQLDIFHDQDKMTFVSFTNKAPSANKGESINICCDSQAYS
jgi:cell cycle checkpoint control protein RAD9A